MDPEEVLPLNTATTRTIRDTLLIDFYEKFTQETQLVDVTQLSKWVNYCKDKEVNGICYLTSKITYKITGFEHLPYILEILTIGEGKISVCGLQQLMSRPKYLELYFDSCTIDEANNLLLKSLEILDKINKIDLLQIRDGRLLIIGHSFSLFFCFTIYENKGSLLRNLGQSINKHGWNPFDGYFGSISGGITCAMGAYQFDLDFKRSKLHELFDFGAKILFHGFTKRYVGEDIITTDGHIEIDEDMVKIVSKFEGYHRKVTNITLDKLIENIKDSTVFNIFKDKYVKATKPDSWLIGYIPYVVGIDDDMYVILNNIINTFNLGKDLLNILCTSLLEVLVIDAKQRLFSIGD